MTASIARYLKDFGELPPAPPVLADDLGAFGLDGDADGLIALPEQPVDLEAERSAAYDRGVQAAEEAAERRWAEEREKLEGAHAEAMSELRQKHETEVAALIASRIPEMASILSRAVSEQTARILAPLLDEALVSKAVADMADLINAAILDGGVASITVRGPAHLHEQLSTALGGQSALLRHVEADDLDISVDIGEAVLVTRMSAWSARLKKVLA